jgi:hypothetical protein
MLISDAIKVFFLAVIVLFCGPAAFAQDGKSAALPTVEDVYLAKDDGGGKAGEVVTEFGTGDVPIHCVVVLDSTAKVTVKMNFVAVAVPGVKADSKVVSASYTTTEMQNRVNFTGRPDGRWTPGRYRVDIFIDGKAEKQLEFSIKGTAASVPAASKFVRTVEKPKPKPRAPKN